MDSKNTCDDAGSQTATRASDTMFLKSRTARWNSFPAFPASRIWMCLANPVAELAFVFRRPSFTAFLLAGLESLDNQLDQVKRIEPS